MSSGPMTLVNSAHAPAAGHTPFNVSKRMLAAWQAMMWTVACGALGIGHAKGKLSPHWDVSLTILTSNSTLC